MFDWIGWNGTTMVAYLLGATTVSFLIVIRAIYVSGRESSKNDQSE